MFAFQSIVFIHILSKRSYNSLTYFLQNILLLSWNIHIIQILLFRDNCYTTNRFWLTLFLNTCGSQIEPYSFEYTGVPRYSRGLRPTREYQNRG